MVEIKKKSAFLRGVEDDSKLKRLNRMREKGIYAIDTNDKIKTLLTLQTVKQVRHLTTSHLLDTKKNKMFDAIVDTQSKRSSVVDIKLECQRAMFLLDEHLQNAKRYLKTRYNAELREFSTQKNKDEAVTSVLEEFIALHSRLKTVIALSDEIIKDLDQGYWSLKLVGDMLQLFKMREL